MSDTLSLFSLAGKYAAISGCTRGIGVSMAMGLAEAGADVCLLQRNVDDVHVRDAIRALGRRAEIIHLDASDQASVRTVVDRILQVFPTLDILVNNAGMAIRHKAVDFPEDDFDKVIQVNLKAVWTMSQAAARHMIPKGQGKIISTASVLSYQGGIFVPSYSASKGAVATLTKAMANEWAKHGINVNAIAPGYIATDMNVALREDPERSRQLSERIPAGRWGTPDDFKGPIVYLASRASDYVHGEMTLVDGGWMGKDI
ncbi:2-deoxy-D-gluconate 3-dehydrogenase [Lichtheimia ornata]|uniref:2-deoxy-D-gluconate 3-dehydrogenase n=1 Tax=Lichtheimia ornata TaxID=688661 RepID=A0AAD7XSD6_9FUNG|nr:2-deoxy-D-gluconate 3-dehydrogenase [Lichtheimia ornata]KAJ8652625.1 2-deoxy-D-gluconate 3-dehydrogenase [Lichtheimia ornata]